MIADKYGAPWVLGTGAILYAVGLVMTAYADTAAGLNFSAAASPSVFIEGVAL